MIHDERIRKLAGDYTPAEIIAAALGLVDDEPDPMAVIVAALDRERVETTRHRQRQVMLRSIMDGITDIHSRAGQAVDLCREAIVGDGPEWTMLLRELSALDGRIRAVRGTAVQTSRELAK